MARVTEAGKVYEISEPALEFAHECAWPDNRVELARLLDQFSARRAEPPIKRRGEG